MKSIVTINKGSPVTTTLIIANGVGNQHKNVMQLLRAHKNRKILSTFETAKVSNGGRPVEFAYLTEKQATFLITLMKNTDIVLDFKETLVDSFYEMRNQLTDKKIAREDGKRIYRQKTDVIKQFVEYASSQGSKSASHYFSNLAQMENRAMFIFEKKYKNMREVLTIKQLMQVSTADFIIEKALTDGMEQGIGYKECYALAKERIIEFVGIIGKSPILLLGRD